MSIMSQFISTGVFAATFRMMTTVGFAALATLMATKSGIMHMGQEGLMLLCALAGVAGEYFSGSVLIGILLAIVVGIGFNLLYALFVTTCRGDHVVVGVGINFFASGITALMIMAFWKKAGQSDTVEGIAKLSIPLFKKIPVLDAVLGSQNVLFYILILAVVVLWILIYKTPFGLQMRVAGELPLAVACTGKDVNKIRYSCMAIGGILFALAGANISLGQTKAFSKGMISGRGFVALAMCMLGRNHPVYAFFACMMYGYTEALQLRLQGQGASNELLQCIPYVFAIVVIAISGSLRNPAALGKPYPEDAN